MNIIDIINKKRLGKVLTKEEINYFVMGYVNDEIEAYQVSALLMAITINGMDEEEVINLTEVMLNSGDRIDLSKVKGPCCDKHSTGGVGDKTTLIIAPIVASLGINMAKMSGRGLGHTGGTIDKLESIPSFQVNLSESKFIKEVKDIHMAIVSQTTNLVPADKKIYALRDVTATVESIPLIASSIMSKKIASGAKNIVIDLKVGTGALIKNKEDAVKLANLMIKIGRNHNVNVRCVLTNMSVPLGHNVGNALEVEEVIDILTNNKEGNLRTLCIELSCQLISMAKNISIEEARLLVEDVLASKKALNKFYEFVEYQHGDISLLPTSKYKYKVSSYINGYITNIDAYKVGKYSLSIGSGRINLDDKIDYSSGIEIVKDINDYVSTGDTVFIVHSNKRLDNFDDLLSSLTIDSKKVKKEALIYEVIK